MKTLLPYVVLGVLLTLCVGAPVSGRVANVSIGGDDVVYDDANMLLWYPRLTDTLYMTRAQQETFIADELNADGYAGLTGWRMATSEQTQWLKVSLAGIGETLVEYTWPWTLPGTPRDMGSPFLAYRVPVEEFFTPTSVATQPLMPGMPPILDGLPMQVFNGRTTGWWWRTDVPTTPYYWADGEADDHFVVSEYMTPGEFATMTYNYDVHYLSDDATTRDAFPGPFGAWIVLDLAALVEDFSLHGGIENSLVKKLESAFKKLSDGNEKNDAAAIKKLGAFINEVEAQRDKKITSEQAAELIATAQAIIALLGG